MSGFALAIQVERTVAEIYATLSRRFDSDPELRALFSLLREEELSHGRRIERLRDATDLETLAALNALDVGLFTQLLLEAETVLAAVVGLTSIGAEKALGLAVDLELRFSEVHAEALTRAENAKLTALFRELSQADLAHREMLQKMAAARR